MDTSVSYIAKPRGAIAFVIKLTVVFLQMASPFPIREARRQISGGIAAVSKGQCSKVGRQQGQPVGRAAP